MIALFFDTETTGFPHDDPDRPQPDIVQFAGIVQDTETKRVLHELNIIVAPRQPIPPDVTELHGISTGLANTYGMSQLWAGMTVLGLLEKVDLLVAHNIEFDIKMIELNWPRTFAIMTEIQQYDTMRESIDIVALPPGTYHKVDYSEHKPPKLREAYQFFMGEDMQNEHDAMADVRACRDIFFKIQEYNHQ